MKLKIIVALIFGVILLVGCTPSDAITDDLYTGDHFPAVNNTYDLGSNTYHWANVWTTNLNGAPYVPGVAAPHDLLSITHPDTSPDSVVRGDLITGQGAGATWTRLPIGGVGTFLASDGTDASWRTLLTTDIPDISGTYVPYTGASSAVDLGAQNLTTNGIVGIGTPPAANNLISVLYNAGGLASTTALDLTENSASAGAKGIDLMVAGAKTANTWGVALFNGATSNTGGINKYGLSILSTGVWDGAAASNYALYINEAIGGTANWTIYTTGGSHYFGGATSINGALNMNTHQINNVVDPTLAQDAATKNYVDTGLGGIYVPYSGATGAVDLNNQNLTNVNTFDPVTINAFSLGGTVTLNGQTFSGAAVFDSSVTIGITGSNAILAASVATAGATTKNSPTLTLRANYWNGAVSTAWNYNVLNIMSATTPASTVSHKINSVSLLDLTNTNSVPTGRLYGHWGIGTTPISNAIIQVAETFTDETNDFYGIYGSARFSPANNSTKTVYGNFYEARVSSGISSDASSIKGIVANAYHYGTGTVGSTYGIYGVAGKIGDIGGVITSAYGVRGGIFTTKGEIGVSYSLYGENPSGGGTIYTAYGLYLQDITAGSTNYAIYSAGGHSYHAGNLGLGIAESAVLTLKAGTTTSGTAPLKFTSGSLMTASEVGAIEFLTDAYYGTITTGTARKQFAFTDSAMTGQIDSSDIAIEYNTGDYGIAWATYTPPTGRDGRIVVVWNSNLGVLAGRIYAYVGGAWHYAALM
jgi:hypothetical protein